MFDISYLFGGDEEGAEPTRHELWSDRERMQIWLRTVFDKLLSTPEQDFVTVRVPPYQFPHDARNLYSVSLLSLVSTRPDDASLTRQDFEYLYCDSILKYLEFPGDETELFLTWASTNILRVGLDEPLLNSTTSDFIRDHLIYQARHDPVLGQLRIADRANFIPLFVSLIFSVHIGGLWPQLLVRIEELRRDDAQKRTQSKLPFKLIELFLNRFAEEDLRFRAVTAESVKEAMGLLEQYGAPHPVVELNEATVLRALHLPSNVPPQSLLERTRSVGARVMRPLARRVPISNRREAATRKKRVQGVDYLEVDVG